MRTPLILLVWLTSLGQGTEQTLLFVDDAEVLYRPGTKRVLQQPQRFSGNPVLVGPTIKNQVAYCSLYRDPETHRYQMWYQMSGNDCVVCYAESDDGVEWRKPELDLYRLKGIDDRNVVWKSEEQYGASVVVDPLGGEKSQRYKLVYWSIPPADRAKDAPERLDPKDARGPHGGMYVAFSPDGVHWKAAEKGPVLSGTYGRIGPPPLAGRPHPLGTLHSVSDVLDAMYDPIRNKYAVYAKGWIDGPDGRTFWKRAIVRSESADFLEWTPAELVMAPDENDGLHPERYPGTRHGVQLHGAPTFLRHGIYFSLVQIADFESDGEQPIELAISRDGRNWSRPFRATSFLPVGRPDSFDAARIWSNATPIFLDKEIRFYFGGAENPWQFGKEAYGWGSKKRLPKTGIGFATLPVDRFASIQAIDRIGQVTLRPRELATVSRIALNANAANGSIRVELLNERGYRIRGFSQDECQPIQGDHLRQVVTWSGTESVRFPDAPVMIRIHLDRAELFSLSLEGVADAAQGESK